MIDTPTSAPVPTAPAEAQDLGLPGFFTMNWKNEDCYTLKLEELDYNPKDGTPELPKLPFGVAIESSDGEISMLNTYTFRKSLLSPPYDWQRRLSYNDEKAGNNIEKRVKALAKLLADTVETIGGIPIDDVVQQAIGLKDRSKETLFSNCYMADAQVMLFGLRLFTTRSLRYSVRTMCACGKEEINDTDPGDLHDLKKMEINYSKVEPTAPIAFRIDFPDTMYDPVGDEIHYAYLSPLRLYQIASFQESTREKLGGEEKQAEMSILCCPESNVFATPGKGGMIKEFFRYLTPNNCSSLTGAIASIGNGKPFGMNSGAVIEFECPICPQGTTCTANPSMFMPRDLLVESTCERKVRQ